MRGHLSERRPGYWELKVSLGRDPMTGKAQYRTRGMRGTKREAERALARLVTEVDDGRVAPTRTTTVGTLLNDWLAYIENEGRSPTTMRGYRSQLKQLPAGFLKTPLRRVTPKTIDELFRHLALKPERGPTAIRNIHAMLRAAFNQAMRWELMDRNPAALVKAPRIGAGDIEPPPVDDVIAVFNAAEKSNNPDNALAFRLLAATGCRRSELCGMQWGDFNDKAGKLTIRRAVVQVGSTLHEKDTKAHQQRTVQLDGRTRTRLQNHHRHMKERAKQFDVRLPDTAFIFSDEADGSVAFQPDRLSQAWRRLADVVGTDARLHDLRHLQASILLDAGESIPTVAARLGHRDAATTLRVYSHLMPGADGRSADIIGDTFDPKPKARATRSSPKGGNNST